MSITEAGVGHVEILGDRPATPQAPGDDLAPTRPGGGAPRQPVEGEMPTWRITKGVGFLTLHLAGEFRLDRDLKRFIRTVDPFVRDRKGIRRVLVDTSALGEVPAALLYTIRVLDREARIFHKAVDRLRLHPDRSTR